MRTGGGGEARRERRTDRRHRAVARVGNARDAVRPLHRRSRSTIIIDAETGGISSRNDAGYGVRGEGEPVRTNHQLVYGMHTQHAFAGPLSMKPDIRPSRRRPPGSKSLWPQVFLPGLHIKRWIVSLLLGVTVAGLGLAFLIREMYVSQAFPPVVYVMALTFLPDWLRGGCCLPSAWAWRRWPCGS